VCFPRASLSPARTGLILPASARFGQRRPILPFPAAAQEKPAWVTPQLALPFV